MVDFNGIKTFIFDLEMHQHRWQLGSAPDPTREAHLLLNSVGEDGHEEKMNLPPQSQFLCYATVVNLNRTQKLFFHLKCTKIASGWGSAPDPAGGAYSAPPDLLAVREGRREGRGREGEGRGGWT